MSEKILQRDALIDAIFEAAQKDKDIYFISADLGAKALDRFRAELPRQFIHAGISEQNMIDLAAGLAMSGKKVFCYAMASFITARCYEQVKCALAAMRQPVTLIAVGVGLGYDDAGPTHYTTEDIASFRALPNMEIHSPADAESTLALADLCLKRPALRLVRLERPALPAVYNGRFAQVMDAGFAEVAAGQGAAIISSGFLLHRALAAREKLAQAGIAASVFDLFRVKPLDGAKLAQELSRFKAVVTVEEQVLAGGFGTVVLEALADNGVMLPVKRLGLPDRFYFENGGRGRLLDSIGLSVDAIADAVRSFRA